MANSLITNQMIAKVALMRFRNSNAFLKSVNRQYDREFGNAGMKAGNSIRIRQPVDYVVRSGPTFVAQDTVENNTTLTISKQIGVDISFSSADRTLSVDEFDERYVASAVNTIAGGIAIDLMSGAEAIPNMVRNADGNGNTISPTFTTWAQANATLNALGAPMDKREVIVDPISEARTVSSFSGLFNSQGKVSQQYATGRMGDNVLGMDWSMDQTVLGHATGSFTAGTVNGANQTGSTLTTGAITGTLNKGDIITIAGVYAVNRINKTSTNQLAMFAVTANVAAGATSIPIYPAIAPQVGGLNVPYQTVLASPANGAAITLANKASETYRNNFVFSPTAVTLAFVKLPSVAGAVIEYGQETYDGVSMRVVTDYIFGSDQIATRLDVLYGYTWTRPEWCVRVPDAQ